MHSDEARNPQAIAGQLAIPVRTAWEGARYPPHIPFPPRRGGPIVWRAIGAWEVPADRATSRGDGAGGTSPAPLPGWYLGRGVQGHRLRVGRGRLRHGAASGRNP